MKNLFNTLNLFFFNFYNKIKNFIFIFFNFCKKIIMLDVVINNKFLKYLYTSIWLFIVCCLGCSIFFLFLGLLYHISLAIFYNNSKFCNFEITNQFNFIINYRKVIFELLYDKYIIYDYFDLDFFFQNRRKRKRHKLGYRIMNHFDRYFSYLKQRVIFGYYNQQYSHYYYSKLNAIPNKEVPLKNISILTTDTVTFVLFYLKLFYTNFIYFIFFCYSKLIYFLNKIPNIYTFFGYINNSFAIIYFYSYFFFKYIFIFFYKCIDLYFIYFIEYFSLLKSKMPLVGMWCHLYESKEYPKAFLQLRVIYGNTGFDIYGPPYNVQKHFINFFGQDFELKYKNISLYIFDWINLRDFILLVQLIHNLKKIYWIFIYEFAGNINYCIHKGVHESVNLETGQLNIFKLFLNGNFLYGCGGFLVFFFYHALYLEFFFFILDQLYLFLNYWYWRYLKVFGNPLQKSKANLIVRGFDLVDYQKEAEIVLKDLNSTIFGLFLSFEAIMKERMILDPEEMLIAARFLDVEYRYRLIEFFMEFFHRLEEEIDKNRPLTFMEEILNHEDVKTTEEAYLKYFYKSEKYDFYVKDSIAFKIENKFKKQRNDRKNTDLFFFKNNPNIIFEKKHFEVLSEIYKEQLMAEYESFKYNLKKK